MAFKGSRPRALQKADPVTFKRADRGTALQAVLPHSICNKNSRMVVTGLRLRSRQLFRGTGLRLDLTISTLLEAGMDTLADLAATRGSR